MLRLLKTSSESLFLTAITLLSLAGVACNTDPNCPEGATVEIRVASGQCYDVDVRSGMTGDQFVRRVCSQFEQTVNPGRYQYTITQNGNTVASGSRTISCGDTTVIDLANGTMSMNTTPGGSMTNSGRPSGTVQLACGCYGPQYPGQRFATSFCASGYAVAVACNWACPAGGWAWGRVCE